jgi:cytochrome b pre-mRNA-processing protein 3
VAHVAQHLTAFRTVLDATPLDRLTAGDLPGDET